MEREVYIGYQASSWLQLCHSGTAGVAVVGAICISQLCRSVWALCDEGYPDLQECMSQLIFKKIIMHVAAFRIPDALTLDLSNLLDWIDDQQVLPLQRKDLEPCALGTVGNLRFSAQEGVTNRTGLPGGLLAEVHRLQTDECVDVTSLAVADSSKEQAQCEVLLEVRANSRRIGNLLGSLTAKPNWAWPWRDTVIDDEVHVRTARALIPPMGNLYSLKGAKYCLDTYLHELNDFDLATLCDGLLSNDWS